MRARGGDDVRKYVKTFLQYTSLNPIEFWTRFVSHLELTAYVYRKRANDQVRENANCGDRLVEGVAKKLQFLTLKDYQGLFSELAEAATAYEVAHDREGSQVSAACYRH